MSAETSSEKQAADQTRIAQLENDVAELRERLDTDFANLRSLIVGNHEQVMQTLEKSRSETSEPYAIPSRNVSSLQDLSLYAKLKQRFGETATDAGDLLDESTGDTKGVKHESDLIKLTCFDFKVTEPLGFESRSSREESKATKPWWKIFCLCSLLPEDDSQSQAHYHHQRHYHDRSKTKHGNKKARASTPRPIAEGLEDNATAPPSIMSSLPGNMESEDESITSVVVQTKTDYSKTAGPSDSIKIGGFVTETSSSSETDSDTYEEETVFGPLLRFCRIVLWDIIYPTSTFRTRWDLYMLLLFAYVCVVSPYIICFGIEFETTSTLGMFELIVNVSFALDIFLNFRTAYLNESNRPVLDRKQIAKNYAKTWLLIDVISIIPFDDVVTNKSLGFFKLFKATRVVKIVKIVRLFKIVKMLRIVKIPSQLRHLETMFNRGVLRLVTFMSAAILVTHLCACFFYYSSYLEGFDPDTWVGISGLQTAPNFDKYVTALYWSMSTLTTVGYGDVIPGNSNEKIMSMIGMVIGVTVFAYFMGSMSSMMSSLNNANTRITKRTMAMEDFLKKRKVPAHLADRVRTFFQHILSRQIVVDETSIINELSLPLRTELILFLYRDILGGVPFFKGKDPQFIVRIVPLLKLEYYAPGEVVIRQGDPGDVMYFIAHGHLEVRIYFEGTRDREASFYSSSTPYVMKASEVGGNGLNAPGGTDGHPTTMDLKNAWRTISLFGTSESYKKIGKLRKGEYFGEYSCLLGEYRTATVVAEDYCELYSLSRSDLDTILDEMPELGQEFLKMVEGYVAAGFGEACIHPSLKRLEKTKSRSNLAEHIETVPEHGTTFGRRSIYNRILSEASLDKQQPAGLPQRTSSLGI